MNGTRGVDIGGEVNDEEAYEGPVLVVFAVDPGITTGWSALKVPVLLLPVLGVARTLVRCRHAHGQIGRSGARAPSRAGGAYDSTDPAHVTEVLGQARSIYDDWCMYEEPNSKGNLRLVEDEDVRFAWAVEGFDLRMQSKDPSLLAPVRVANTIMDRLDGSGQRVFFQSASDAKNIVTDTRLKSWMMYDRSSGAHARDADRHAITFVRRFTAERSLRTTLFGYDVFDPLASPPSQEEGEGEE